MGILKMFAGMLSRRVVITKYKIVQNSYGKATLVEDEFFRMWANVKVLKADEHTLFGDLAPVNLETLKLVARRDKRINADCSVKIGKKEYSIVSLTHSELYQMTAILVEKK